MFPDSQAPNRKVDSALSGGKFGQGIYMDAGAIDEVEADVGAVEHRDQECPARNPYNR